MWRMQEISELKTLRTIIGRARVDGDSIGFVPTMGYLHPGHLRLIECCRAENDCVVVSIFVNPTQFSPSEDFERYPRDLDRDRELTRKHGVDLLFVPTADTMYPEGAQKQRVWVDPGDLAVRLEGLSRPDHFRGVTTVVAKLLNMVQPDRAYFGQKDGQQATIVSRMVTDLAFPAEIRIVRTERAANGLAFSSRNAYLSLEERTQATVLWRALDAVRETMSAGARDPRRIQDLIAQKVRTEAPLARLEYAVVSDLKTLVPLDGLIVDDALIALAVYFSSTRLIDNMIVHFIGGSPHFS
jgi:pantoate--beta-alanine ligase